MVDEKYRMQIACKQVYTILNLYNRELLCLILPKEVLEKLKENSAKDYDYNINPNTFSSDDITDEASAILLIIFDKYFANQTQKDKISRFLNIHNSEKFNYDLLFKKKNHNISNSSDLVVYEEKNTIKSLIIKIKLIFQKRKKMEEKFKINRKKIEELVNQYEIDIKGKNEEEKAKIKENILLDLLIP